jgi:Na+/melibiose symporter-like transporter
MFSNVRARLVLTVVAMAMLVTACGDDRGGVIVDSSGEQGGGTQPGGGGFAFVILFLVVLGCALAMFAMDRIRKNKSDSQSESSDQ